MPDPENTQPATSPDQNGNVYGITPADENEMKAYDQARLEEEWKDVVNFLVAQGTEILPYSSPSGDAFEQRVNQIIDDYVAQLQTDPSKLQEPYNQNRSDVTTSSAGSNVAQAADPVNLFNGDFVYAATDFQIDGAGMDFVFTRAYSQLCSYRGPLGVNWDHRYNLWLRVRGDGLIIQRSNGALHEETFRKHEQHDYWFPLDGGRGVILEDGPSFVHRLPDGARAFYQPHPTLDPFIHVVDRIEDRFGNHLRFAYTDGLLTRVEVNHPERVVDYQYDSENRITSIRDYTGRRWRYTYDDLGDLAAVTTPATEQHPRGLTTGYDYSTALTSDPNVQHQLLSIIDADGLLYLENEYGTDPGLVSYRRVTLQRQGGGDVVLDYADVIQDFDFAYADYERPTHQTVVTGRDGRQSRHLFDRWGHLLFGEEYARMDGVPRLVSSHLRYNQDGNLVGMMSPLGAITQMLYGREMYERQNPPGDDYRPETDPNLTPQARLQFDNLLAVVTRGRYHDVNALNLSGGLWSSSLFPDILQTAAEDVIQKITYEPEFTQLLTISDPRVTRSADPAFMEDPEYDRRLTRFTYSPGDARLLESVELPTPTLPDGTASQPVRTRFPDYDDRGRKIRVVAPNGLQTLNAYHGAADGVREGFLKSTALDPGGLDIVKGTERDELGRAVRVFRPPFFDVHDDRFFTTFAYNVLGQLVRSTSTAPFAITTVNQYNRSGNLARSETELKDEANAADGSSAMVNRYDEEQHLISQVVGGAGAGKRTIMLFDQAARPFLAIDPSGRKRRMFFTERSLVGRTVEDFGGVHAVTRSFYDPDGRLVRLLDPRGGSTRLRYDALGRLVDTEDAQGNRVIRHFDKLGNLLVECRYEKASADQFLLLARREFSYDELGWLTVAGANRFEQPVSIAEAELGEAFRASGPGELLTVQSFYDNVGNLVKLVNQDGREAVSEHDLLGRVARKIDPHGNEVRFRYDKEGNVLRVDRQEVTRDPVTDAVVGTRHFAEVFTYDELNRLVERKTSTGRLRYQFDSRGNPVVLRDALGQESRNRYDVFGRLTENRQLFHRHRPGDVPVPVSTSFTYDLGDRKTSQTDALGRTTHFRYDTAGRPTSTVLPDGSSDASTYDRAGNLTAYRDRNGLRREFEWDTLNRPIALRVDAAGLTPGAEFVGATVYRAGYDGLGRFKRVSNDFVVNEYSYDSLDHVLQETSSFTAVTGVDPSTQFTVGRAYSNTGALTVLTYPSGREIHYVRDALDRVLQVRQVARGADYPGDPATPDDVTVAAFQFDGLQLSNVARANGASTGFAYDLSGRTVQIRHARGPDPVLTLQFLYDAPGNLRQRIEAAQDFQSTETFAYDSLSRLFDTHLSDAASLLNLSSISPPSAPLPDPLPDRQPEIDALLTAPATAHTSTYDYDLVGNRLDTTRDGANEHYDTNELDQYADVDGVTLRYDRNGNLAEDNIFRYAYDHRNQLTRMVRKADGWQIDLCLDYFGRRCLQTSAAQREITVYEGPNVLEQYDTGQLKRSVVSDTEQDGILVTSSNGSDLYLLSDLVGSVRYVFDGPDKANFYVYDEFGNLRNSLAAGDDNPFRFAGKQLLDDTGKYDFVFRVYDPSLGRFIQRDPSGYVDGCNLYLYGKNNPLVFRDPNGLESRPEQTVNSGLYSAPTTFPSGPQTRAGQDLKRFAKFTGVRFGDAFDFDSLARSDLSASAMMDIIVQTSEGHIAVDEYNAEIDETSSFWAGFGDAIFPLPGVTEYARTSLGITTGDANPTAYAIGSVVGFLASILPGPKRAPIAKDPTVAAKELAEGFERVPGAVSKITREADEVELFARSERFGNEYATYVENGQRYERIGKPTEVKIPSGPGVTETLHTHPLSGVALTSTGDVTNFAGHYGPGTKHSVLGRAFPEADRYLQGIGLDPSGLVMKTTFSQRNLEAAYQRLQAALRSP